MTEKEFLDKYGKVKVYFKSYFKYVFTLAGKTDKDNDLEINIGGDSSEIYRLEIDTDTYYRIEDLHTDILSYSINGESFRLSPE